METDTIINTAISELDQSSKVYISLKDLTFMQNLEPNEFNKIKYILFRSEPFENHSDSAIRFSKIGLLIVRDFDKDWFKYKKSLKKKSISLFEIISVFFLIISFCYNLYQDNQKDNLRIENERIQKELKTLQTKLDRITTKQ